MPLKPDANQIEAFLDQLASEGWVRRGAQHWWPKFVFHYSDVRNVVRILHEGRILCRRQLEAGNGIPVDCASPTIINQTHQNIKNFVRLYFRPRTPTQFHMEGIRPTGQRALGGAHCPVPIFLLFDSKAILSRMDCEYSDGNLAASYHRRGTSANFLKMLPFRKIYHVGPFDQSMKSEIVFHRNAEVIIPNELDLSALRFIVCRSPAEMETLIYLLPLNTWEQWHDKILVEGRLDLFELRWTFVERVDLSKDSAIFNFSPDTRTPGPYQAEIELVDQGTGRNYSKIMQGFTVQKSWSIKIPSNVSSYTFQLKLDGDLAYMNSYSGIDDIPF